MIRITITKNNTILKPLLPLLLTLHNSQTLSEYLKNQLLFFHFFLQKISQYKCLTQIVYSIVNSIV